MRVSGVYLQTVQGTGLKDLLVSTGGQKLKRYHSGATGIDISPEHYSINLGDKHDGAFKDKSQPV
jgi:hypothetical protein